MKLIVLIALLGLGLGGEVFYSCVYQCTGRITSSDTEALMCSNMIYSVQITGTGDKTLTSE